MTQNIVGCARRWIRITCPTITLIPIGARNKTPQRLAFDYRMSLHVLKLRAQFALTRAPRSGPTLD